MKRIVVDIDDKLHRDFKVYCYGNGKTIKEVVINFMKEKVKKKGDKK